MSKRLGLFFSGLICFLLLTGCSSKAPDALANEGKKIEISGKVTNKADAQAALSVLQANLQAASEKNADAYLKTISKSGRQATAKEMKQFFKDYTVKNTLLSFEVKKEDKTHLLVQAQQKSVATKSPKGKKYRNHISEANHTFIKEDGQWRIKETSMSDTTFLD